MSMIPVSYTGNLILLHFIPAIYFLYIVLMLNWANHISSTPCFVSASVRWVFAHVLQPRWPVCMQLVCHYVSFYSGRRADVYDLIPLLRRWYYTGPRTTSDLCSRWYSVLPAHTLKFLYFLSWGPCAKYCQAEPDLCPFSIHWDIVLIVLWLTSLKFVSLFSRMPENIYLH